MTGTIRRLGNVVILVADLDLAEGFYREVLGLVVVRREPINDAVHLAVPRESQGGSGPPLAGDGGEVLSLYDVSARAPRPQPGATGYFRVTWAVDGPEALDAVATALRERGAYGGRGPQTRADGLLTVYGQDPDGNRFEVRWQAQAAEAAS